MRQINFLAVVVAALAAVVVAGAWYIVFGGLYMELLGIDPRTMADQSVPLGELLGEFVRCFVVACTLAYFVARLGVAGWKGSLQLGLCIGVGFQSMLLMGAVIHEGMPWKLYAIHAGDALVKTLLMTMILGLWRR